MSQRELRKIASQIEFLHQEGASGEDRFHAYKQTRVIAVGSGPVLVALVTSLFESGLSRFHVRLTNPATLQSDRERLGQWMERARRTNPDAVVIEIRYREDVSASLWREVIRPFDSVFFVSPSGDIEMLRQLMEACREENKMLIPALVTGETGLAGPLMHMDSIGNWESAWRRVHRVALGDIEQQRVPLPHSAVWALLANVIVFEHFKTVTGWADPEANKPIYWLNARTCEGDWLSFAHHPAVTGQASAEQITDLAASLEQDAGSLTAEEWFDYFKSLTSAKSGILHSWEEGALLQLPLSQCRVQAADPSTEGPAELLQELVIAAPTHELARWEAGLAGIEDHVSRMARELLASSGASQEALSHDATLFDGSIGVGAGQSLAEGACRGLRKLLAEELGRRVSTRKPTVRLRGLASVEDEICRYYIHALITLLGHPEIAFGEDIFGFPSAWVGAGGHWYGSVGLNRTAALRQALAQALQQVQNEPARYNALGTRISSVRRLEPEPSDTGIPELGEAPSRDALKLALRVLERNGKQLLVFRLLAEPFLEPGPIQVFGVLLREEASE